jgi:hypothetical protein
MTNYSQTVAKDYAETGADYNSVTATVLVKNCREQAGKLVALIGELEDRLGPVLGPPESVPQDQVSQRNELPPLVAELYDHGGQIAEMQAKVQHLIGRIQA